MNTALQTIREHRHPPELPRLSLLDRLALHGGLALIRWARRDQHTSTGITAHGASRALDAQIQRRELVEASHRLRLAG